jgi:DNA-binding CsgD family transcriptional regulator
MSQQEDRTNDSHLSKWLEDGPPSDDGLDIVPLSAARARAMSEAGAEIARQLNGPLTALLLYMGEIKQHSHQFLPVAGNRAYLQQVVENALQQTERVCAMVKQIADVHAGSDTAPGRKVGRSLAKDGLRTPGVMFASSSGQKPLTKREREVLDLISEGYSNKQGALRMQISPRTFESHRAEAMRKLGARNTADLVRTALLHPGAM